MKHMKLIALFVAIMMVQGTHASPKVERAKQMGSVGFHLAKVIAGWKIGGAYFNGRLRDQDNNWCLGGAIFLIADGLHELHHDLHRHIFTHLNAWWQHKSKKE
jgi:hypothetical protein